VNAPTVSIIVPMHNSSATIEKCLESAFSQNFKGFEVIAVDDASSDSTVETAEEFRCSVVRLEKNSGAAAARNAGAKKAEGGILVFIDSDIVLPKGSLARIIGRLEKGFDAVGGIVSGNFEGSGIVSFYKNSHNHYFSKKLPSDSGTISGFFMAVKKSVFLKAKGFNETFREAEDIEFCRRLQAQGAKILFDKTLQVGHIQKYSFFSLLRGDFLKGFYWARLLRGTTLKGIVREKRFTNRPLELLAGIFSALLIVFFKAAFLLSGAAEFVFLAVLSSLLFVFANACFFSFIAGKKPLLLFPVLILRFFDLAAMGFGAMLGVFRALFP
jgi:glycosyltransferase involved in cell wall biosynthesis